MWPALVLADERGDGRGAGAALTQDSSDRITALVKAFQEALRIAHSPASNTKANIQAKTLARNEAVRAIREVINAAKALPPSSETDRVLRALNLPTFRERERQRQEKQATENRAKRVVSARQAV